MKLRPFPLYALILAFALALGVSCTTTSAESQRAAGPDEEYPILIAGVRAREQRCHCPEDRQQPAIIESPRSPPSHWDASTHPRQHNPNRPRLNVAAGLHRGRFGRTVFGFRFSCAAVQSDFEVRRRRITASIRPHTSHSSEILFATRGVWPFGKSSRSFVALHSIRCCRKQGGPRKSSEFAAQRLSGILVTRCPRKFSPGFG